jgi:hypothetical protein
MVRRALANFALLAVVIAPAGCSRMLPFLASPTPAPSPFCELPDGRCQTWVAVYGPSDLYRDYVLQIGEADRSLRGGPGVVSQEVGSESLRVRVLERSTCDPIVEFVAGPGTLWVIRFRDVREATVTQVETMEAGPALTRQAGTHCP